MGDFAKKLATLTLVVGHQNSSISVDTFTKNVVKTVTSADNLGFIFDGCESALIEENFHYYATTLRDGANNGLGNPAKGWHGKAHVIELALGSSVTTRKLEVNGMRRVIKILRRPGAANQLIVFGRDNNGSGMVVALNLLGNRVDVHVDALGAQI